MIKPSGFPFYSYEHLPRKIVFEGTTRISPFFMEGNYLHLDYYFVSPNPEKNFNPYPTKPKTTQPNELFCTYTDRQGIHLVRGWVQQKAEDFSFPTILFAAEY